MHRSTRENSSDIKNGYWPNTGARANRLSRSDFRALAAAISLSPSISLAIAPGEELDESLLSTRYSVSRTPVREALIRLASEKLVVLSRNRRATVQPLDLAGFPGYLEALDLLQRAVTRLAAEKLGGES